MGYEIKESSPAAVEAMLRYIYTGDCECPVLELPRLLDLSVQYELSDLCEVVASQLATDVTPENVRERLAAMKRYQDKPCVKQSLHAVLQVIKTSDVVDELLLALV